MVLIFQNPFGGTVDIVFVLKSTFTDFYERHCRRKSLHDVKTTCIVDDPPGWLGKPSLHVGISLLGSTLHAYHVAKGEASYVIPVNVRCREFDGYGRPISEPFAAALKMRMQRIDGRSKAAIAEIQVWARAAREPITHHELTAIKEVFAEAKDLNKKEMVFLAQHIHPVRARSLI